MRKVKQPLQCSAGDKPRVCGYMPIAAAQEIHQGCAAHLALALVRRAESSALERQGSNLRMMEQPRPVWCWGRQIKTVV